MVLVLHIFYINSLHMSRFVCTFLDSVDPGGCGSARAAVALRCRFGQFVGLHDLRLSRSPSISLLAKQHHTLCPAASRKQRPAYTPQNSPKTLLFRKNCPKSSRFQCRETCHPYLRRVLQSNYSSKSATSPLRTRQRTHSFICATLCPSFNNHRLEITFTVTRKRQTLVRNIP